MCNRGSRRDASRPADIKLSPENISRVLNAYIARKDEEHFTRLVPRDAIEANDYNISVSSYVEQADTREVIDIHALNKKIAEIVKREDELRKAIDVIVTDLEGETATNTSRNGIMTHESEMIGGEQ